MQTLEPPGWPRPKGYANGIAASGHLVFVAGQVGWDESQSFASDDLIDQAEQALSNIVAVLAEAQAGPEHIVRMTWYLADRSEYLARAAELGRVYRQVIGKHFPAMTAIEVSGFVEAGAKIEIEATAVVP